MKTLIKGLALILYFMTGCCNPPERPKLPPSIPAVQP